MTKLGKHAFSFASPRDWNSADSLKGF